MLGECRDLSAGAYKLACQSGWKQLSLCCPPSQWCGCERCSHPHWADGSPKPSDVPGLWDLMAPGNIVAIRHTVNVTLSSGELADVICSPLFWWWLYLKWEKLVSQTCTSTQISESKHEFIVIYKGLYWTNPSLKTMNFVHSCSVCAIYNFSQMKIKWGLSIDV